MLSLAVIWHCGYFILFISYCVKKENEAFDLFILNLILCPVTLSSVKVWIDLQFLFSSNTPPAAATATAAAQTAVQQTVCVSLKSYKSLTSHDQWKAWATGTVSTSQVSVWLDYE